MRANLKRWYLAAKWSVSFFDTGCKLNENRLNERSFLVVVYFREVKTFRTSLRVRAPKRSTMPVGNDNLFLIDAGAREPWRHSFQSNKWL